MTADNTLLVQRQNYRSPDFAIDTVELEIFLRPQDTEVRSRLTLQRLNPSAKDLLLDGEGLELLSLSLDGKDLSSDRHSREAGKLRVKDVPEHFVLESRVRIQPEANTALSGLYYADEVFLTQCEAEGFRRITWFLDRPDVLARFTVTLHAPKVSCPILLSNGNCVATGDADNGWHWARWEDPFPKPCYLFAAVGGSFHVARDRYRTGSGREIGLELYVAERDRDACEQALQSLQKAMAWDEKVYGREYDLDRYLIVATDSFNMGAMENKGLNIFNSKYVLASPETATDADYQGIESVIAHEYFHNWTGNRVTLRDWFQLSLKEGLTVFRDQEFSADMNSRGVQRIGDVRRLRAAQFAEDASALAHPVRPESYKEINNFYTATVYEKGAEVIRMMHTLLGVEGFRAGTDLYFQRHDGQAVRIEELLDALATGSGRDLSGFLRWYSQAGTPRLKADGHFAAQSGRYHLRLQQHTPVTPGQEEKLPVPIPVRLAFFHEDGTPARLPDGQEETVLLLEEASGEWTFGPFAKPVLPSLLRGFSAPVLLERGDAEAADCFLAQHDDDPFNRWDSLQRLAQKTLLASIANPGRSVLGPELQAAFAAALSRPLDDPAFSAELLSLPTEESIGQQMDPIDVDGIHTQREALRRALGDTFAEDWRRLYHDLAAPYRRDGRAMGSRRLRNLALYYAMSSAQAEETQGWAERQYRSADNMTDRLAALQLLAFSPDYDAMPLLNDFYQRWQSHPLIIDRWFSLQLGRAVPETLQRAQELLQHPAFSWRVPNRVRAVLSAFAANLPVFHARDGSGYHFYGEQIRHLDDLNPQTAARLATVFSRWSRYDEAHQRQMRTVMEELLGKDRLSRDLGEILERSLGGSEKRS
ncbi:aminopeptidase N [Acidithiobacillus sp. CV18-2]|uniref:Aminopeptidase N n=1 Tax=Igneacidithiobacillus copahuensis TaxID=2724909 RepID=A0AAE2YRR8_9PROT|nr:aminopeptidase N [Igneacidithiobacillus copahuensis]MBU2753835.1 aminopeptidase N [Acidithiobacillus sp. CV18-3]MBU2756597.1 aminopeptidase N [Acidithiobacillus sp. BN09-2]MBU2777451.1 aminopeptidase N [Acidithiobacillus sp. CV18-2]MBU2796187.1 aminopeptidase N [Acidithiobacillus sp. VAN18-2]MBU2799868.1 aminopeptidase N [Acidithiobacillus sp. VAN18-4]UTV82161.1 aminopeptidase N [Acidithiobacillus sp. YTS05]